MFSPVYRITPAITKALMSIEADRQVVSDLPIDVTVLASLRETARLVSTHYSTQIEGNRLTQAQVKEAIAGARFPGKERDELEVRHHYRALEEMERLAAAGEPLAEGQLRRLHGLVMTGQSKPTPYRDGQNVIRNSRTREIVYMPPEAKAVPGLMSDLVKRGAQDQSGLLRNLDPRERRLLELFRRNGTATAAEIANHLKLSHRTVVGLCRSWLKTGFLELQNRSRKNRAYRLGQAYLTLIE